jgi:hypothetical protein
LYKQISREELQDILAGHLLDLFERTNVGRDDLPVLLLEDIALTGIFGENELLERL